MLLSQFFFTPKRDDGHSVLSPMSMESELFPTKIFQHGLNQLHSTWTHIVMTYNDFLTENSRILNYITTSNTFKYSNKCLGEHFTSLYRHQDQIQHTPSRSNPRQLLTLLAGWPAHS